MKIDIGKVSIYSGEPIQIWDPEHRKVNCAGIVMGIPKTVTCSACGGQCRHNRDIIPLDRRKRDKSLWVCPVCIRENIGVWP